jgi:hypothetical protein
MVTTTGTPLPVDAHRPAPDGSRVGRWLRMPTGVKEDILDWVPEERSRYTRLGAIILNTGILAALSMLMALGMFISAPWPVLLTVAAFWGWMIICIDSWLISSTHGTGAGRAFWIRLMLSVVIGFAIAEPLLLKIFEPAIQRQVTQDRVQLLAAEESGLRTCNPVPYQPLDAKITLVCKRENHLLTVRDSPAGVQDALQKAQDQQKYVQGLIDQANTTLAQKNDLSRQECNGRSGTGLSGQIGVGPNCRRDRQEADQFLAASKIDQHQREVADLQTKIVGLQVQLNTSGTDYAAAIDHGIKSRLAAMPQVAGKIGILEADKGLGQLSGNFFVLCAQWLVRLLLVLIDCLPILTKRISGITTYDRMFSRQLVTDEDLHAMGNDLLRERDLDDKRVELKALERKARTLDQQQQDQAEEERRARENELNDAIDALAAQLRNGQT